MLDQKLEEKRIKMIRNFKITGFVTLATGLLGFFVFVCTDLFIVHPSVYIMMVIMGMGWLLTAYSF